MLLGLRAICGATLGLSVTTTVVSAQQVIEIRDLQELQLLGAVPQPVSSAGSAQADKDGDEKPKDSPRLKLLAKLVFDRRPSEILKAWSTPLEDKPEVPPDPEAEKAAEEKRKAEEEKRKAEEEAAAATEAEPESDDSTDAEEEAATEEEPATTEDTSTEEGDQESQNTADEEGEGGEAELTEEEALAKEEAEEAEKAAKAKREAEEKEAKKKAKEEFDKKVKEYKEAQKELLDWEMKNLQRMVSLSEWSGIAAHFSEIEDFEAEGAYKQMLTSLVAGPVKVQGPLARFAEKNFFVPDDLHGLVGAAPMELENAELSNIAQILRLCVSEGNLLEFCIKEFRPSLAEGEEFSIGRSQFARILIEAGFPVEAGEFLPDPDSAIAENLREELNLLTRHYLAVFAEDQRTEDLEHAWRAVQAALADGEVTDEAKEEALVRAVSMAPDVREELGQAWLDESFTKRPERGMEILRVIGAGTSKGLFDQARNGPARLESMQLQSAAAKAVLAAAPELATEWSPTLSLLANNWLQEALHSYTYDTSTTRGPSVTRDMYGNVFYSSYNYNYTNRNIPTALSTDDLLEIRPSDEWLQLLPEGLQPKFQMVTAQLLLKVNDESEAFPYIERLALVHPEEAKGLVHEFLRVWTKNNNPNTDLQRTSQFMFIYGYDARAQGIPLTRSKQERNLKALAGWVARIRDLPLEDIDESLIANAFTSAHSRAEVYQLETIERVFGDMAGLEPKTFARLVESMRTNLADVWRQPAVQKDNKTQRRQKDIQQEILRGYEVAAEVATQALAAHPDDWSLMLARASVAHDENNFRQEIAKSTEFAGRRREALADFARAAELYEAKAPELKLDEETVELYQTWFYASLGACDLKMLDHEKLPATDQYPQIRASLDRLPTEVAKRAKSSFASGLFTRMSNVNPAVKFRYVRAGLEIVGDHPGSKDARDVADYYGDLVTEIKLETSIDGSDDVGHGEPFGMFVNIRHTGAIEREAGGFSKYLVNQNSNPYGFNYGRPPEDYRDKFDEATREALSEHFEVLSVTFNHPDTNSRATEQYGWRITPYAYVLMKARGPEIDKVPPLRLDLDFVDTTGYAVLPAESAPLPIDASAPEQVERPYRDLKLTQTLDERQADKGKLLLEVKASALGLVPDVNSILDLAPEGFEVVNTEDQGVAVAKFDEEADETAVVSERIWMVSMAAKEELAELPESFEFGASRAPDAEMEYLRYVDSDLENVAASISLEQRYGETDSSRFWIWGLGLLLLAGACAGVIALMRRGPDREVQTARFQMPDTISAFTVIGLLRDIERNNGVDPNARAKLVGHIEQIEGYYFDEKRQEAPDLEAIAKHWVR